jgi:hypothetical protein
MKNFHSVNDATLKNKGIKIADKYNLYRLFVSLENKKKFAQKFSTQDLTIRHSYFIILTSSANKTTDN